MKTYPEVQRRCLSPRGDNIGTVRSRDIYRTPPIARSTSRGKSGVHDIDCVTYQPTKASSGTQLHFGKNPLSRLPPFILFCCPNGEDVRYYLHRGNYERGNDKPSLEATAPANEENAAVPRRTSLKRRTRGNKNKDYRRARYSVKDNKIRSNALARQPRSLRDNREERGKTITIAYSRGMSRRSLPASRWVRKLFPNMSAAARAAWWNTSCS